MTQKVPASSIANAVATASEDGSKSPSINEEQARKALKAEKKAIEAAEKANARTMELEAKKADSDEPSAVPAKTKLRFESQMDREEIASYLEAIVKGLRQGSILFRQNEESLTLRPSERVEIEVKAACKNQSQKLSFEISWSTSEPEDLTIIAG